MLRATSALAMVVLAVGAVVQTQAGATLDVNVTGAWTVTITRPDGSASGLAILSQDGTTVTGMIGPADTDMMPAEGTVDGDRLTLLTRPRSGRTAAFARCELTGTNERMTGTIDGDKGTIEFVRKRRQQ